MTLLIVFIVLAAIGGGLYYLHQQNQKTEKTVRSVRCVNDLKKNDMVRMSDSFALPELLRNQTLTVVDINSSNYDGDIETEWVLQGPNDTLIYLGLDEDDSDYIELSVRVKRAVVETLFDLDNFAEIFDNDQATQLTCDGEAAEFSGWYTKAYTQDGFGEDGVYHAKTDLRQGGTRGKGEVFTYYSLSDGEEEFGIGIEVWANGETDVSLTLYRPARDIVDFLPGA